MQTITFEVPALYADHHVVEVRRILLEIPGVKDVYASSAFNSVEITFDPKKVNDLELQTKLEDAGYLGDWSMVRESEKAGSSEEGVETYFRHTAVYEQTRQVVSFAQKAGYQGRPLWPCPGMGILKKLED